MEEASRRTHVRSATTRNVDLYCTLSLSLSLGAVGGQRDEWALLARGEIRASLCLRRRRGFSRKTLVSGPRVACAFESV